MRQRLPSPAPPLHAIPIARRLAGVPRNLMHPVLQERNVTKSSEHDNTHTHTPVQCTQCAFAYHAQMDKEGAPWEAFSLTPPSRAIPVVPAHDREATDTIFCRYSLV